MRSFVSCLFVLLIFLTTWNSYAIEQDKIRYIVVFGDSMSDAGNLRQDSKPFRVPAADGYWKGHFSNGPVWIEYVAALFNNPNYNAKSPFGARNIAQEITAEEILSHGNSHSNRILTLKKPTVLLQDNAVGGALASANYKLIGGIYKIPSITNQVENYLESNPKRTQDEISHSLYALEIGGNDYLHERSEPSVIISKIQWCVETLIAQGGQYFLLPSMPNLGDTFLVRHTPEKIERRTEQTNEHNKRVEELVNYLKNKYPDKVFIFADVNKYFQDILKNLGKVGKYGQTKKLKLSNADYCNKTGMQFQSVLHSDITCKTLEARKTTVFWDNLHPSTSLHCIMGKQIYSQLQKTLFDKTIIPNYSGCLDSLM